jgi:hypothetical protein
MEGARLGGAYLQGSMILQSKLLASDMTRVRLDGASILFSDLSGVRAKYANMTAAIIFGSIVRDIDSDHITCLDALVVGSTVGDWSPSERTDYFEQEIDESSTRLMSTRLQSEMKDRFFDTTGTSGTECNGFTDTVKPTSDITELSSVAIHRLRLACEDRDIAVAQIEHLKRLRKYAALIEADQRIVNLVPVIASNIVLELEKPPEKQCKGLRSAEGLDLDFLRLHMQDPLIAAQGN